MQFTATLFSLAGLATSVSAQTGTTIKVTVGDNGTLAYSPSAIAAAVGTAVEFEFFPKNHTVAQSSFADPCHPLAGGFFSGFVPTKKSPSGSTFTIVVNDTRPIWIYCGQTTGGHCQSGMVAAINAPTTGNTLAAFIAKAKNATTSSSPSVGPVGGILSLAAANSTSTNSSSSTTSSATGSLSSKAVSTLAILSTYVSGSQTYTTTVGSSTIYSSVTASSTSTSPSSTSTTKPSTGSASGLVANPFGVAAFMVMAAAAAL